MPTNCIEVSQKQNTAPRAPQRNMAPRAVVINNYGSYCNDEIKTKNLWSSQSASMLSDGGRLLNSLCWCGCSHDSVLLNCGFQNMVQIIAASLQKS